MLHQSRNGHRPMRMKLVVNRAHLCVGDRELPEQRENPLAVGH